MSSGQTASKTSLGPWKNLRDDLTNCLFLRIFITLHCSYPDSIHLTSRFQTRSLTCPCLAGWNLSPVVIHSFLSLWNFTRNCRCNDISSALLLSVLINFLYQPWKWEGLHHQNFHIDQNDYLQTFPCYSSFLKVTRIFFMVVLFYIMALFFCSFSHWCSILATHYFQKLLSLCLFFPFLLKLLWRQLF